MKTRLKILHLAGILLLALYLIAGAIYSSSPSLKIRFTDEREYLNLCDHLLNGSGYSRDGVHPTAWRPPGYPFFLATIKTLGGGVTSIRIVQYALAGATLLLLSRISSEKDQKNGLIAPVTLVMLYPVLFYTCATLYPQTLASFLFILALTFLTPKPRGSLLNLTTGLSFGLLILVIPTFALTLIIVLVTAGVLQIIRWRDALLIFAAASLVVGSWTARNALLFHEFIPVASNSGENLLIGNCENTVPYGGAENIDISHYANQAKLLGLDEFQEDHYYQKAALHWISHHPVRALVLYGEKTLMYFSPWNEYAPGNNAEISPWKQIVMAVTYVTLLALLAWRFWESNRFPLTPREKLFLTVYLLGAFTSAIFFIRIRYRLPSDYLIIAVIATHLNRRLSLWLKA